MSLTTVHSEAGELPQVVPIRVIGSPTGTLGVTESHKHSPFSYARFYFMTNLAPDSQRGGTPTRRCGRSSSVCAAR